jgi:tetratricopeptide (TPR) repeat protein
MSNSSPILSLCMIVKNEEKYIGHCLSSVKKFVDEIIVVDTGCEDKTLEIASRFGARIFSFPWIGDFSQARNYSISQATGKWVLVLDADERLAARDACQLRSLIENARPKGFLFSQRTYLWDANYVCSIPNPRDYEEGQEFTNCIEVFVIRLFRNDPEIRYQGRVHELVEPIFLSKSFRFEKTSLVIHHYGKVVDARHLENKKQLYLDLGTQKATEEPLNPMAQFEIGVQLYEIGRFGESIPYFEAAFRLNKTFNLSLLYVAKAFHVLGKIEQAAECYRKCIELVPANDRVLFEYANFQRDQGHLKNALKLYQKAISLNPSSALSVFNMGGVELRLGHIEKGFSLLQRAIHLNPDNEVFHENFGKLSLQGYFLEDAANLLENFLQRFPESQRCPPVLAEVSLKLKRFEKAIQWASRALQDRPSHHPMRLVKAHSEFFLGRLDEAALDYQEVLLSDTGNLDGLMNLGSIAEHQQNPEKAELCFGQVLESHPNHPLALKKYGMLKAKHAPASEALPILRNAYLQNPDDTECLLLLGYLYEQCDQSIEAIELYREAQQRNPRLAHLANGKIRRLQLGGKTESKGNAEGEVRPIAESFGQQKKTDLADMKQNSASSEICP